MLQWLREEIELRRLRRDQADGYFRLEQELRIARARNARRDELHQLASQYHQVDIAIAVDNIAAIRTKRLLRTARRLLIPTPDWPSAGDEWEQSSVTYAPILSPVAEHKLRREIAVERELRQKPWLNWVTLVIALISLVVSLFAFSNGTPTAP
jgi:hypothetical protein